jgi:hypothetical protein
MDGSAMPEDTLLQVLLIIFGIGIGSIAIGGGLQAWRSWTYSRRIQKHLSRH